MPEGTPQPGVAQEAAQTQGSLPLEALHEILCYGVEATWLADAGGALPHKDTAPTNLSS